MHNVMWIAGVFGPFMAILGLWMLLYVDNAMKVLSSVKGNPGSFYLAAIFHLFLGIVILNQYNVWSWDAYVLITLLGWLQVIRGAMGLFMPQLVVKVLMSNHSFTKVMGIIPLVWGLALCWLAYFM